MVWGQKRKEGQEKTTEITNVNSLGGKWMAHLHTVEASEQVVEDDHVAVDGEERQETRDGNQEEHASCRLQAGAAGSHEKLVRSCQECFCKFIDLKMKTDDKRPAANIRSAVKSEKQSTFCPVKSCDHEHKLKITVVQQSPKSNKTFHQDRVFAVKCGRLKSLRFKKRIIE